MKEIKNIVVVDCDGTTLNGDGVLSNYTYNILEKISKENLLIFATGRFDLEFFSIFEDREPVGDYVICDYGASIYNLKTKELIYENSIQKEIALDVVETLKKNFNIPILAFNIKKSPIFSIGFCFENKYYKQAQELIEKNWNLDSLIMRDSFSTTEWLVVSKKNVNKGECLKIFLKNLSLEKQIIAIGDAINDIPLLEVADVKVAMGNAIDDLKNIATDIAPSYIDDGAAKWLEKNLL